MIRKKPAELTLSSVITLDSCVLTVMMLDWFGPGALPSPFGPVGRTKSDVSTYQKIWAAGRRLEYACPDENASVGWCAVGEFLNFYFAVLFECFLSGR